ncbi:MAG: potassium transporter Kup [Polyangiaceae bacterium]|nr:potassium transporter Kup [Polyangiaceae bacterium]
MRTLIWAALGVVFGDVGTSPLYAMSETVSSHLAATQGMKEKATTHFGEFYGRDEVLGWTSLFFWAIAVVVTLKYVVLIMRADNQGEGGMFSILALLKAKAAKAFSARGMTVVIAMAVIGSGLILGDGVITPSLSIMSAWEGLEVVTHRWSPYIPALSVATLIALFAIQRFGTAKVGAIFAPAMAVWFTALAVMGLYNLVKHPDVLFAINPVYALRYVLKFPRATLYVVGSVDLCITGCEALYADMGHFSRPAVRRAWFWVVWPALVLNYLGQGARLLDPAPIVDGNVFYALVPSSPVFVYPLVLVSWLATIIASQALISGAFSLVNQAIQLGLFPRTNVVHTNAQVEGQIYVPEVNWGYLVLCILLVLGFKSSHNLAPAYGLAVTGTMGFTTILFYLVATRVWKWRAWVIGPVCALLICVDLAFFLSNATQFLEGGYVTILIAVFVAFVMFTWKKGRTALSSVLSKAAMPLEMFLSSLRQEKPHRVPGTAVFMTSNPGAPPALIHYFKHAKTLHERILLLTVETRHVPEVPDAERLAEVRDHGDGVFSAKIAYGFIETPDIPKVLGRLTDHGVAVSPHDVSFFLGRESLVFTGKAPMSLPRKVFFKILSQNAVAASTFFRLPPGRVIELGIQVEI